MSATGGVVGACERLPEDAKRDRSGQDSRSARPCPPSDTLSSAAMATPSAWGRALAEAAAASPRARLRPSTG